jgi:hypothetical protein
MINDVGSSDLKTNESRTIILNDNCTSQHESIAIITPSSACDLDVNGDVADTQKENTPRLPLDTVLELTDANNFGTENLDEIPSTLQSPKSLVYTTPAVTPTTTTTMVPPLTATGSRQRNRTDSLRVITDKFRSISNDLLRSIESAHEMIDLNRSHFSAATQSAAAQQYQSSENNMTPSLNANAAGGNQAFSRWPKVKKELLKGKVNDNNRIISGDPASDFTIKSVDLHIGNNVNSNNNEVNSNLPSTSMSSYGLVNEQENLNVNKFYSLNRGDSMRNDRKGNDYMLNKEKANALSNNESMTDDVSTRESCYYSPKSKMLY